MTYAGIRMLMEKLDQLINCNDIPFFNYPEIIRERPQFQLLYEELRSIIQTLFIDQHQDLDILDDLKQRFIYAAEEAQYIVDRFLSDVQVINNAHFPTPESFNPCLNLDEVRRSLKSVQVEFMSMRIDNMKTDSSPIPETTLNQFSPASITISRNSQGSSVKHIVGFERDAILIIDKLVEDQRKLDVVSIIGASGIGKTTLATKVFNDPYVKHQFHVCVWVTVSQTYDPRAVMIQMLESIGVKQDLENASDSRCPISVHECLLGKRYLIVIDDIWNIQTWDNLKHFFPYENNGSRILLTTRFSKVAKHVSSGGFIHHLNYLNEERSWELLCRMVYHGNECPEWSIKPGMEIVKNCQGIPLAVVVIAGVLAKQAWNEKLWLEIADKMGSDIVGEQNGCLKALALSYNHLPPHLRECFLYLGVFPEDYEFQAQRLIWLWVAEGFIQQDGNRSLEDIAKGYMTDLIDRNLVIVARRSRSSGAAGVCILHDLVRELCLKKAVSSHISNVTARPYNVARLFINDDSHILGFHNASCPNLQSILCFTDFTTLKDDIAKYFCSFLLLRVLDLQKCRLNDFPEGMELLVHLRYLAIWNSSANFPPSICNLWSLQTLIYITGQNFVVLPSNISDLVNLRHLWSYNPSSWLGENVFVLPSIERPMNLQTISPVQLGDGLDNFQKCFPYIKELTCRIYSQKHYEFTSLTCLEKLKLTSEGTRRAKCITFPATLKTLTLRRCGLPWSDMSIIQSLTNLQVLKLKHHAFKGCCWNTYEQEFPHLKFLRLEDLEIEVWGAYNTSFPCLRQLEIIDCRNLKEIPHEIGDIPTLEHIKIRQCSTSLGYSVGRIEDKRRDFGNYNLKVDMLI